MKKVAFITGGAKRIGKEITIFLAKKKYNIILHYNNSFEEANKIKDIVNSYSQDCYLIKADFSIENEILQIIPYLYHKFNKIDLLINNASIFYEKKIIDTEQIDFNNFFNINFKAPFYLIRDFARYYKKGIVINILDYMIDTYSVKYSMYSLTKKILKYLTEIGAKEFGPDIRINGIAPGFILKNNNDNDNIINLIKNNPLKRKGKIKNILLAIDFLIKNNYITGETIFVDGGQHLK